MCKFLTTCNSVSLKSFKKFETTADALASATALVESKMSKDLKKFLTTNIVNKDAKETLGVADKNLGAVIKDKLNIKVFLFPSLYLHLSIFYNFTRKFLLIPSSPPPLPTLLCSLPLPLFSMSSSPLTHSLVCVRHRYTRADPRDPSAIVKPRLWYDRNWRYHNGLGSLSQPLPLQVEVQPR